MCLTKTCIYETDICAHYSVRYWIISDSHSFDVLYFQNEILDLGLFLLLNINIFLECDISQE